MPAVTISFCLDTEHDKDLLLWLRSQQGRGRSAVIRQALRRGLDQSQPLTIDNIRQAIRQELASYTIRPGVGNQGSEPERAAANLNALEERLDDWG